MGDVTELSELLSCPNYKNSSEVLMFCTNKGGTSPNLKKSWAFRFEPAMWGMPLSY